MTTALLVLAAAAAAILGIGILWRMGSRGRSLPCPSWLAVLLENPYMEWLAGGALLLDRARVGRGMWVLDVGSGPGRLALPAAERVGRDGRVVALDVQPAMIRKLEQRAARRGLTRLRTLLADAGEADLEPGAFDRAFLVTVLGEIPDKPRALRAIHRALKPGGILSVTEVLPDPHYQSRSAVRAHARAAGFTPADSFGTWLAFTSNFTKDP